MKGKIILFVILFVFTTNSVTYALNVFPVATNDIELLDSPDLRNEVTLYPIEEDDVFFQDAFNMWLALKFKSDSEQETYTVVEGDNLYRIALEHNIPLETLMSWNDLSGDLIYPDDVLIVSSEEGVEPIDMQPDTSVAVIPPIIHSQASTPSPPSSTEDGEEMLVTATAYTAYCTGCSGTTAYGIDLRANPEMKVIAVDPRIIPLGTKVWVEGYGEAIAGDTGGAIKGNKIDVFIPSHDSAMQWGVKKVKIRVIN